jgi:hypothetical protein
MPSTLTGANLVGARESREGGAAFRARDPRAGRAPAPSVGTAAIFRFARPVCFQDVPDTMLPDELRSAHPRGIWGLVDGRPTRDPV